MASISAAQAPSPSPLTGITSSMVAKMSSSSPSSRVMIWTFRSS